MNAAGSLGFAPDTRAGITLDAFGAFVTNPFSLRPRLPAARPEILPYPGGFLLHTGLPNPGFNAGIRKYASRWDKAGLPIIVHLMADRPEETQHMVQMLELEENVMAVELGFAPLLADDLLLLTLEMALGEVPLIFSLPIEQVLRFGSPIDPGRRTGHQHRHTARRTTSPSPIRAERSASGDEAGRGVRVRVITGRLYGPSLFPRTLEIVYSAARLGLPIIGAGGVWSKENADAMLAAGALAVQVDAELWSPGSIFSAPAP